MPPVLYIVQSSQLTNYFDCNTLVSVSLSHMFDLIQESTILPHYFACLAGAERQLFRLDQSFGSIIFIYHYLPSFEIHTFL